MLRLQLSIFLLDMRYKPLTQKSNMSLLSTLYKLEGLRTVLLNTKCMPLSRRWKSRLQGKANKMI